MTSERVTAVMLSRANNGQWNGGRVPYGYAWSKEERAFSLVEHEVKAALKMAELYEQYQSLLYVVKYLNDTGIPTRTGKQWTPTSVRKILTNSWNIGQYIYNVHSGGNGIGKRDEDEWVVVENHHPPIFDEDLFYRLKFMLERNRQNAPAAKTYVKKNIHIFGGMIRCGKCGSNMIANLDRRRASGFRPSQYACGSRRRKGTVCTNKYISDAVLGPFVMNCVANIIRASKNSSEATTTETLERKLLRGDAFAEVVSVNVEALEQLLASFSAAGDAVEYRPQLARHDHQRGRHPQGQETAP